MSERHEDTRESEMPRTDHFINIDALKGRAKSLRAAGQNSEADAALLAAELLEIHDATGISLDNWATARRFVETRIGESIDENGV